MRHFLHEFHIFLCTVEYCCYSKIVNILILIYLKGITSNKAQKMRKKYHFFFFKTFLTRYLTILLKIYEIFKVMKMKK